VRGQGGKEKKSDTTIIKVKHNADQMDQDRARGNDVSKRSTRQR